jgi:hypothetical protein
MVTKLKDEFDRGLDVVFDSSTDPHVVSGVLKLYIRELADPLIPFDMYNQFISVDLCEGNFRFSKENTPREKID